MQNVKNTEFDSIGCLIEHLIDAANCALAIHEANETNFTNDFYLDLEDILETAKKLKEESSKEVK